MENIKVGEYIRTDLGNILKYTGKEKEFIDKHLSISNKKDIEFLGTIVKHSKNIIDLIELYDYVNGMIVFDIITYDNGEKAIKLLNGYLMNEKEIKDILTHEQYQANCYTVKGRRTNNVRL